MGSTLKNIKSKKAGKKFNKSSMPKMSLTEHNKMMKGMGRSY